MGFHERQLLKQILENEGWSLDVPERFSFELRQYFPLHIKIIWRDLKNGWPSPDSLRVGPKYQSFVKLPK